jgi:hypothetical protein
MKDLTKEDIEKIVKESNEELVGEQYTYLANDESTARKERLRIYSQFIEQTKVLLDQMVRKVSADYETDTLNDADVNFLIDDQLNMRLQDTLNYCVSSLKAIKGPGIKTGSPGMTYPNMYDE